MLSWPSDCDLLRRRFAIRVVLFAALLCACVEHEYFVARARVVSAMQPAPVASASPAELQTAAPIPPPALPVASPQPQANAEVDRDETLFGSAWSCRTFDGTTISHMFTKGLVPSVLVGRSISVDSTYHVRSGGTAHLYELYYFDSRTAKWTAQLADGKFSALASRWLDDTWSFEGWSTEFGPSEKVRMVFESFGERAFRRDFWRLDASHGWQIYSGETCRR